MRAVKYKRRFSIAPMMDRTDRHFRYLIRSISKYALLHTEMITTGAILFGDRESHLAFNECEHPIALQLGGSDPVALAECASIASDHRYDEINLNVGCPSNRVQKGRFGACLMKDPHLVASCVRNMARVGLPVTVKCRIGTNRNDSYQKFSNFIRIVNGEGGCNSFAVHARIAWLEGLSPKQNRTIPPLRYEFLYRLKKECPELEVVLNGGINSLEDVERHLCLVDGVMVGRAAYQNPWLLSEVDSRIFGEDKKTVSRIEIVEDYLSYALKEMEQGVPLSRLARHLIPLYKGCSGARAWRRFITENSTRTEIGATMIRDALVFVERKNQILCAS